ncbi:MAG: M56 family metallopeptidase [Bacteroidota bacterium]
MSLNIIASVFTDQLIAALCNTLVYSLLQGVVLAAVAGLVIVFTRKASAATRYNLLVGALVLFAISTAITFVMEFGHVQKAAPLQTVHNVIGKVDVVTIVDQNPLQANGPGFMAVISGYLHTYRNTIVLVWFLIICAKAIQLATGLQGIYRLKRTKVYGVNAQWEQWVQQMVDKLGIRQKIGLLESGIAQVPMVIGHLKPVILIPVGLLTALTPDEVEAILMHELAHIRRRDYLVNLLQSLVEIVYFFNPAVLWVSQLIKTEREHCCDDMALAQNTSRLGYIRALVSCQEYQAAPAYAMGFPGQKNHLVDRVKRMITNRNHSLDLFEKTLLTICLVMSGLCLSAFAERDNIKRAAHAVVAAIKHQPLNKNQQQALNKQADGLAAQQEIAERNEPLLQKTPPRFIPDGDTVKKASTVQPVGQQKGDAVNDTIPKASYYPQNYKQAYDKAYKPGYNTYVAKKDKYDLDRKQILADMLNDGLISSTANLAFKLSNKEFVINGKTQADDIYQKYRAKYVPAGAGAGWAWTSTATTTDDKKVSSSADAGVQVDAKANVSTNVQVNPKVNANTNVQVNPKVNANTNVQVSAKADAYTNVQVNTKTNFSPQFNLDSTRKLAVSPKAKLSSMSPMRSKLFPSQGKLSLVQSKLSSGPSVGNIGDELLKARLITDKNNFTVKLNANELVVNGEKQSEENHKLMLSKFEKKPGDTVDLNYSYHNTTPGKN